MLWQVFAAIAADTRPATSFFQPIFGQSRERGVMFVRPRVCLAQIQIAAFTLDIGLSLSEIARHVLRFTIFAIDAAYSVVFLATFTAERQRKQELAFGAEVALSAQGYVAFGLCFEGGVGGVARADKLMQSKGERFKSSGGIIIFVAARSHFWMTAWHEAASTAVSSLKDSAAHSMLRGVWRCSARSRHASQGILDPGRERMSDKSFVVRGNNERIPGSDGSGERCCIQISRCCPLQRFTDDLFRNTVTPKMSLLTWATCCCCSSNEAAARHRRRSADELDGLTGDFQPIAHAAHQSATSAPCRPR